MKIDSSAKNTFDVCVIGGGPAGMMAAGRAAERGARVLLLEKNPKLGKKLLITGGGRCNVTNDIADSRLLAARYGDKGKFLLSPFSKFGVTETLAFFTTRGMKTKVENEGRVFPLSNKAISVWGVLSDYLKKAGVTIEYSANVSGFEITDEKISGVKVAIGKNKPRVISAGKYILATGGSSRPETGSSGEAFGWLEKIGHTVIAQDASLVPVRISDAWPKLLQGLSLQNVRLQAIQNDDVEQSKIGKMLFTHFGLSGPLVLGMSKDIGELLKYGAVTLALDLFPLLQPDALDRMLQGEFTTHQNKKLKNALAEFLEPKLAPVLVSLSKIDPEKFVNKISREERKLLGGLLKRLPMQVEGLLGLDKAISASGGVSLEEVDFKTMQSRLHPNLFIIGDVLDFNRPSGGFSLQICWTTGFVAGEAAAALGKGQA